MAVLDVLAEATADLGTNEVARRAGLNASSASRLLATLAGDELVFRVPDTGRWRLGVRLIKLGNAALGRVDVRDFARPHLVALTEATGETTTLSLPVGNSMITVDYEQSTWSVRSVAEVGRPSVPHATAVGKIFLTYGGTLPDGGLRQYTARTVTDRMALGKEIAEARERGWAEGMGEREDGLNAIAAPMLDARGKLLAVLGVQGPAARFDRKAVKAATTLLLEHANRLSLTGRERLP
jgi:IclR family acetate operon transcriptional repressor